MKPLVLAAAAALLLSACAPMSRDEWIAQIEQNTYAQIKYMERQGIEPSEELKSYATMHERKHPLAASQQQAARPVEAEKAEREARAATATKEAEQQRLAALERENKVRQQQAQQGRQTRPQHNATQPAAQKTSAVAIGTKADPRTGGARMSGRTNGIYAVENGSYTIQIRFKPGKLTVIEPNKTSVYKETSPNVYEFINPANRIRYGIRLVDAGTVEAFKPGSSQPGTILKLASAEKEETSEQQMAAKQAGKASATGPKAGIQSVNIDGRTFFYTSKISADLAKMYGTYHYEKEGEPVVILERGGKGYFQPHGVPRIRINYWLQTNEAGQVQRVTGKGNPNFQVTLIVQYLNSTNGNYPSNGFDRIPLTMDLTGGYAIILGERFKPLN